jgi:hypothetical protein
MERKEGQNESKESSPSEKKNFFKEIKSKMNRRSFRKEKFEIDSRLITNACVSFQAHNGMYISAENGGNLSVSKLITNECKFYLSKIKKNIFVLETFSGMYM